MADLKISQLTGATTPLAGTEVLPIVQSSTTRKVATDDLTVKNVRSNATTGILQIAGPGAGTTRTMTTPNANFTAARTDAAQTFSGLQTFSNAGNESIQLVDGTNYATIQQTGAATYFNGNITLPGGGSFFWRHTSSYATIMGLAGATGNLTLNTGNLVQGTAAKGINFTANTPAAGMTSQLLNWYEEGTWTPTYTPASGSFTSITYGFNTGQYTRIGSLIYVSWRMRTSALTVGSASGNVSISGLPFAVSGTSVEFALGVGVDFGVNNAGSGRANASTSTINLLQSLNNTSIVVTDLSTGGANNFTAGFVCYRVA